VHHIGHLPRIIFFVGFKIRNLNACSKLRIIVAHAYSLYITARCHGF